MEARHYVGIVIIIAGVGLQPVGWVYYYPLQILSFILIFIGVAIFATQKYLDRKDEALSNRYMPRQGMPGDIHDYSGWSNGGKSQSYQNFHSSDSGDGGGGGD